MKLSFLAKSALFSIFCFLAAALPVEGFDLPDIDFPKEVFEVIDSNVNQKEAVIFSDSGFSQPTHNFSAGQTVYVRVETASGGENKKQLRLLDSEKKEIKRILPARTGQGPYVYTASFSAPSQAGIYYLDIKIEGEGTSFARQENINVDQSDGVAPAVSGAESKTNYGSEQSVSLPSLTPANDGGQAGQPRSKLAEPAGFSGEIGSWRRFIGELMGKIFSYLTAPFR